MKRRNITPETKLAIVLEGSRGERSLAEICNDYQVCQSQYYQWRDKLLSEGKKVFSRGGPDKEAERLKRENDKPNRRLAS